MAVYIAVSSEDVENSVSNMLEAAESGEANPSVQVESKSEREQNNLSESISETEQIKDESEPALVTPSTHQSPLRTSTTTSSVPVSTSPRSVGRPAKGSMVARKIKMEVKFLFFFIINFMRNQCEFDFSSMLYFLC